MKHVVVVLLISSLMTVSGRAAGQDPVPEARQLVNRAQALLSAGRYGEALPLAERVVSIGVSHYGPEHPEVASALHFLAEACAAKGDYARAEPLHKSGLAIREKTFGPNHPAVASSLGGLATLLVHKADYAAAEPLFDRALAILKDAGEAERPASALLMSNLAELHAAKGDYVRAEPLLHRALRIYENTDGPQQLNVARILGNLAALYYQQGDYVRAEPLYVRAVNIEVKVRGEEHPSVASVLSNLAALYRRKGDYSRAEMLLQRALSSYLKAFGSEHYLVASLLSGFADSYRDKGDHTRAVQVMQRALEIREHNLKLILTSGSEQQKQVYLDYLSTETSYALSLHLESAPADQQAAQLALTTILRRKGRALDAMTDQIAALRRRASPQDRKLLDQLAGARSQLATLQLSGAGAFTPETRKAETTRLTAAIEQLEDQVSRRSSEFRALSKSVTLDAVRQALSAGSALVEIAAYRPFDPKFTDYSKRFGPARYVAYVLSSDSVISKWVELGAADSIEADVTRVRAALRDPKRTDVKDLARALDERVMRPIRRLLGAARHVLISPDGALNLIPFGALVDEGGHYLVENYTISYLTSGRDLLRLQVSGESRSAPVVMGDPLYDVSTVRTRPAAASAKPDPAMQGNANANRARLISQH